MIYRLDELIENNINPITNFEYDESWLVLMLSNDIPEPMIVGTNISYAYTIRISKQFHSNWKLAIGDFIEYCNSNNLNGIIVISENDYQEAQNCYIGHSFDETILRDYEPTVLVHSTSMENWIRIQNDKMLKSWNKLNTESNHFEKEPIGKQLGDPIHFSNYIMFGSGISGKIVVNSKQSGKIVMDIDAEYQTGARLYFDAKKMAKDGLLIRDGAHIKVKDYLPLEPYLTWVSTWDKLGLKSQVSTPRIFSELSDNTFENITKKESKKTMINIEYYENLTEEFYEIIDTEFNKFAIKNNVTCDYTPFNFIAKVDNKIAGIITGHSYYKEIHIGDLIVLEEYRNKYIGTKLVEAVENHYKNKGFKNINLSTYNFQAPDFYKKCGFTVEFIRENKENPKLNKYFLIKYI